MTLLLYCLAVFALPVAGTRLVTCFIHHHHGHLPAKRLSLALIVLCIILNLPGIRDVLLGQYLPPARYLLLSVFSLMFILLDLSNHWLPLEFTASFCLLALVTHSFPLHIPVDNIVNMVAMGSLLAGCRLILNRHYRADVFGLGDIWMMSGLAAYFSFMVAAIQLTVGLTLMLLTFPPRKTTLPLAPFVLIFAVLPGPVQYILPFEWSTLL